MIEPDNTKPMTLAELNQLDQLTLEQALSQCCGAENWFQTLAGYRPFNTIEQIHCLSDSIWSELAESDYLAAFSHHPMIGDMASLKAKFTSTAHWAGDEQQGSQHASEDTLRALQAANQAYFDKFGFIFIVCATGKSADDMLMLLNQRITHDRNTELTIAAAEQNKITHLRLEKLLSAEAAN